jgi:hypothetical protein
LGSILIIYTDIKPYPNIQVRDAKPLVPQPSYFVPYNLR